MTEEEEKHLKLIKYHAANLIESKFRKGAAEHKDEGSLHNQDLAALIDNAIDEAIDEIAYLLTIKIKISNAYATAIRKTI